MLLPLHKKILSVAPRIFAMMISWARAGRYHTAGDGTDVDIIDIAELVFFNAHFPCGWINVTRNQARMQLRDGCDRLACAPRTRYST